MSFSEVLLYTLSTVQVDGRSRDHCAGANTEDGICFKVMGQRKQRAMCEEWNMRKTDGEYYYCARAQLVKVCGSSITCIIRP